jgi:hypothetical protein
VLTNIRIYISSVFDHWLFTWGGIVLMVIAMIQAAGKSVKTRWFFGAASVCLVIAMFQGWQDQYMSAEWRGGEISRLGGVLQGKDAQIQRLQNQLIAKDRPIILQYAADPAIAKLVARQNKQIDQNPLPSPRKRALQVSNDILKFLADRLKEQPSIPLPTQTTREDAIRRTVQFSQAYDKWMTDTGADYGVRFGVPVAEVVQNMKEAGIDVSQLNGCTYSSGNTFAIQDCGTQLGVLAEKLAR